MIIMMELMDLFSPSHIDMYLMLILVFVNILEREGFGDKFNFEAIASKLLENLK